MIYGIITVIRILMSCIYVHQHIVNDQVNTTEIQIIFFAFVDPVFIHHGCMLLEIITLDNLYINPQKNNLLSLDNSVSLLL